MTFLDRHGEPFWEFYDAIATKASWALIIFFLGWFSATTYWRVTHLWNQSNQLHHLETVVIPAIKGTQSHSRTTPAQTASPCPPTQSQIVH